MRFFNLFLACMVEKYQNEILPIFHYGKSLKTNKKYQKIPDLQVLTLGCIKKNDLKFSNGLQLNKKKTKLFVIGKTENEPLLKVEGAGIEEQCVIKLMGIRMDNKMSFHLQAIEVTKQVNNRLFNLCKL